ncbi:MAG: response regulator [Actinomycetota bacterium]|nr:response regulator [Actinomycetota bacterium]
MTPPAEVAMLRAPMPADDKNLLRSVLIVDDDQDVGDVIAAVLGDEGYTVNTLADVSVESVRTAIGQLEPDLILLDGAGQSEYGEGWLEAVQVHVRRRPIPVIMLTGHSRDANEAEAGGTSRAQAAAFAAVLLKPFSLDTLIDLVLRTVGGEPFSHTETGEQLRTEALTGKLRAIGAIEIRPSTRREWATFVLPPEERVYQLYWWQGQGQYLLGAYSADGVFERLGTFWELDEAVAACEARKRETSVP